jgi:Fe2+ transport system protein FeoA
MPQTADNPPQPPDTGAPCSASTRFLRCEPLNEIRTKQTATEDQNSPVLLPLSRAKAGSLVIVRRLTASHEVNQRLREMGFSEDCQIKLISLQSSILCQVCNARLGLNARLAESIWVEPLPRRVAP